MGQTKLFIITIVFVFLYTGCSDKILLNVEPNKHFFKVSDTRYSITKIKLVKSGYITVYEASLSNGLGKSYINLNNLPDGYLCENNIYFDSLVEDITCNVFARNLSCSDSLVFVFEYDFDTDQITVPEYRLAP